ncbi:hypothetical protein SOVF_007110 [Spinacia oleracea]|nr:hypothetical protein SOVF_007110 [Spinacia oleracea]
MVTVLMGSQRVINRPFSWDGLAFGGLGFAPSPTSGIRPAAASNPNIPGPIGGQGSPNAWQPMSPQNLGPSPSAGIHGFGNQFPS